MAKNITLGLMLITLLILTACGSLVNTTSSNTQNTPSNEPSETSPTTDTATQTTTILTPSPNPEDFGILLVTTDQEGSKIYVDGEYKGVTTWGHTRMWFNG